MNTKLLSRFRDDMQLHGLSVHTQEAYERHVHRFLDDTGYRKKPVTLQRTVKDRVNGSGSGSPKLIHRFDKFA